MNTLKTLLLLCFLVACSAQAVRHPVLTNPRITSCTNIGEPCNWDVYYEAGVTLADVAPVAPPTSYGTVNLVAIGMHCDRGNSLTGSPFYGCQFNRLTGSHTPGVTNCQLSSTSSWELTPDSTCTLLQSKWGPHNGAGPGGECILFVQSGAWAAGMANTIHGVLTPNSVANSGNAFCQKALPPDTTCSVLLPDVIDHGTINPNAQSIVRIDGDIDCGADPVITFAGGRHMTLAPGVTTELTAEVLGGNRLQITSDLVSVNGEAGYHSAATVVLVSPY